jgi:hypothetical protein
VKNGNLPTRVSDVARFITQTGLHSRRRAHVYL